MSSNWTGTWVCESCITPPSGNTLAERPRLMSMYLRPSAERGRIVAVESTGILPWVVFRFRTACAPAPVAVLTGEPEPAIPSDPSAPEIVLPTSTGPCEPPPEPAAPEPPDAPAADSGPAPASLAFDWSVAGRVEGTSLQALVVG